MDVLYERVEILQKSGLITSCAANKTKKIIELTVKSIADVDEEKMEIFITHMAMAVQRILNGKCESPMDKSVYQGLCQEAVYPDAQILADNISQSINMDFPEAEKQYLIAHICNLLI